jgi:hypothetical protein
VFYQVCAEIAGEIDKSVWQGDHNIVSYEIQ